MEFDLKRSRMRENAFEQFLDQLSYPVLKIGPLKARFIAEIVQKKPPKVLF